MEVPKRVAVNLRFHLHPLLPTPNFTLQPVWKAFHAWKDIVEPRVEWSYDARGPWPAGALSFVNSTASQPTLSHHNKNSPFQGVRKK